MPGELGVWLREQREIRGWTRMEMARRLIRAGEAAGDKSMPSLESMCHNLYRWERGTDNPSERYKLYYSHALGIPPNRLGPGQRDVPASLTQVPDTMTWPSQPWPPGAWGPAAARSLTPNQACPSLQESAAIAYRGTKESVMGDSAVQQEVLMAAHEGSDHAEEFEQHGIGEATFEQLRADVMRLSRLCDTAPPLSAFIDMRRVRSRIYRLLDRRQWPREQADLCFLLCCVNGLMGVTSKRLGYPDSAEELIRAGWAYANAIDHGQLRGMLRAKLSSIMYWRGWFHESRDLAADGLRHASGGPLEVDLHLNYGRAAAMTGDRDGARRAVELAHAARDSAHSGDLVEIGGEEFRLSRATEHCMAAHALLAVSDGDREAADELEEAIGLYDQDPRSGERHWFGGKMLASTDLATVRLRSGALDAAEAALEPVLVVTPERRVAELTVRLTSVRDELAAPIFQGSPRARNLSERIEDFGREAVTAGLHSLSGGPV